MEGGPPMFRQDCSCPALLEDCRSGFPYGAVTRYGPPFQTVPVPKSTAAGLVRFRSPLLAESRLMSFPPATEMFQFAGFASRTYEFSAGYPLPLRVGCPIRRSRDQRSLASPPGFSQRATSFIASQCQGIHQMPLFRARSQGTPAPRMTPGSPARQAAPGKPPRTGASPTLSRQRGNPARGRSHEDTLRTAPRTGRTPQDNSPTGQQAMPRPVRLGHIHKSALPFNQHQPRTPAAGAGHARPAAPEPEPNLVFSERRRTDQRAQIIQSQNLACDRLRLPICGAMVEVNGIEPTTSCLQSRRSPN